ncbi:MAG: hypothetical protein NW226_00770 [Microscillaceae bacterium]|nr:hypothetical protein [Microscillaceae bacterium]
MMTTISQLKGLYIETAEIDKANRSSNPEALLMLDTRMWAYYIYQPTFPEDYLPSQDFLAFIYWKKWENNYEIGNRIEKGFVRTDDQNPKLLCFYPKNVVEWQKGGGMGYDTSYFKQDKYKLDEEVFDAFRLIKRKEWYFKDEQKTFKPIQSEVEDRTWYFADKPEEIIANMLNLVKIKYHN